MQSRMKNYEMDKEKCEALLKRAMTGRISTVRADGYPYTVAVHFIWENGSIYFHGLNKGDKIDNIRHCPKVCFETSELSGLLTENITVPCKADTAYESVVIIGNAEIVSDTEKKTEVLNAFVKKYIPDRKLSDMSEAAVKSTAVIKINGLAMTGKYHS